jgi:pimeloyl-ACP methyl ester carboxylesterase
VISNHGHPKRVYELIPGAFHGAWCWYKVIARLERLGHIVVAPDLPGTGMSKASPGETSLEGWAEFVCRIIDYHQPEPVILVGHSCGGVIISQAAENRHDKVKALVYVSGALLHSGDSVINNRSESRGPFHLDVILSDDMQTVKMNRKSLKAQFYDDCCGEDICLANLLLHAGRWAR